jgi:ABC transporter substrate binding protein
MTRVERRGFIVGTLSLLAAPLAAQAQPAGKVYRIGTLNLGSPSRSPLAEAFWQGLRELGYVEGRNVIVEERWAEGRAERLPGLAADLVRLKVDVIVADGTVALAAKQATTTIPIVMPLSNDPVRAGLVESLARPGGNVTGQAFLSEDLGGKWMELLKECHRVNPHRRHGDCRQVLGTAQGEPSEDLPGGGPLESGKYSPSIPGERGGEFGSGVGVTASTRGGPRSR